MLSSSRDTAREVSHENVNIVRRIYGGIVHQPEAIRSLYALDHRLGAPRHCLQRLPDDGVSPGDVSDTVGD